MTDTKARIEARPLVLPAVLILLALAAIALFYVGRWDDPPPEAVAFRVTESTPAADPNVVPPGARVGPLVRRSPTEGRGAEPAQETRSKGDALAAAELAVVLRGDQGRFPERGGIELWPIGQSRSGARREVAIGAGPALFRGLAPGRYSVSIEPWSLSSGWVPAHPDGRNVDPERPFVLELELFEGAVQEALLPVRSSARIYGTVFGPSGEPVPFASVRLGGVGAMAERAYNVRIDADEVGTYIADVTPARYMVHVDPGPSDNHPLIRSGTGPWPSDSPIWGVTKPIPRILKLSEGQSVRHDIRFGQGRAVIRGRVVDEDGQPVPDLRVLVYPVTGPDGELGASWATSVLGVDTDLNGRFEITGLEPARYRVQAGVHGAYSPREPPGTNRLGDWPEPVSVDVSEGEEVDLGLVRVWLSRPFVVRGRVISASGRRYDWEIVQPEGWRRRTSDQRYPVTVSWDGDFQWHVETPEGPVRLRALDGDVVVYEETFDPLPSIELWREIRVP